MIEAAKPTPLLPRGVNAMKPEDVAASQRARLLAAMKTLVARDGYPAVTIAAIVGEARVAKPTFYERFQDKEDCFLQLLDESWQGIFDAMVERIPQGSTVFERIDLALDAFLEQLASDQAAARVLLIESYRAGEKAAARMGHAHLAIANVYRESRDELRQSKPELPAISETRALAVVGAVVEPVTDAVRKNGSQGLMKLRDELRAVVHALAFATP